MCAPRVTRHTSIRYSSSCHTHPSTWVHRYSSLLQWSVPLGQRGHVAMVQCTVTTDLHMRYSNPQNVLSPGAAIFSILTLTSPSGRNLNYYDKLLTGKKFVCWTFCLYWFRKYVPYSFPIINFCNLGVYYETSCVCCIVIAWRLVWSYVDVQLGYWVRDCRVTTATG